ncbi:MAG: histidine phosphatase family protein [Hyphomicrobiales bacterium]|nr:histidine phosphatase family protein [Hyphomicrobiales bacterium]
MNAAICFSSLVGLAALAATSAAAQPSRVIILRHAEKANAYALCDLGRERANALAKQFLGEGAAHSLFAPGERPAAFMAVTLHSLETLTPAAQTWGLPVIDYSVVPNKDEDEDAQEAEINARTQEAGRDLMSSREFDGKTVVVAWEHKRIASRKLEKDYRGQEVTFRQLFGLGQAPESWSDTNYDYFWIVDYAPGNPNPTKFEAVKQTFTSPFNAIPAPDWEAPEPKHIEAGCKK